MAILDLQKHNTETTQALTISDRMSNAKRDRKRKTPVRMNIDGYRSAYDPRRRPRSAGCTRTGDASTRHRTAYRGAESGSEKTCARERSAGACAGISSVIAVYVCAEIRPFT